MKTINFNFEIHNFDGKIIDKASTLIANKLVAPTKGDALKYYDWAIKIHKGEEIKVDDSDFKNLYDFINDCETITFLGKAPILKYLNSLK